MHSTIVAKPSSHGRIFGQRILIRIFPYFTKLAVCSDCSKIGQKRNMHHLNGYGWFCTEKEAVDLWKAHQW
jgi:hypothetical protein